MKNQPIKKPVQWHISKRQKESILCQPVQPYDMPGAYSHIKNAIKSVCWGGGGGEKRLSHFK